MGSLLIFTFKDPDGGAHEVVWMKPDMPVAATLKRVDWTSVTIGVSFITGSSIRLAGDRRL
jgi:hypothetical protein